MSNAPVKKTLAEKFAQYSGIGLIFLGLLMNGVGLYLDKTAPNFFLVEDLEVAGWIAIISGIFFDIIANHI